MFQQLEKYKNPPLKLNLIIQSLFEQVRANPAIAHYFISVSLDADARCTAIQPFCDGSSRKFLS
jgi:hypothetical protein